MNRAARARAVVGGSGRAAARLLIFLIQTYRHMVSPLRPPTCRFVPTCSQYAVDALTEYGLIRGSWLAAVRLAKCGPWHQGGWDPIPERRGCRANFEDGSDVWDAPGARGESGSFV
ncbi:membrane protein insertion efficiency factor YidD [Mycobacterium sp. IS-1264]|uniref:membrane protein insertion efficiency factor YidD n=1 Tax=Mycobacterium sp. IS-1264 TaxID=1834158 RepID=UPI00096FB536|nr:membrane protein insertion efficiency factor YidD [Mycobacterium sp. IS-1264]